MGWLDDMKAEIAEAQGARDTISPEPAERIDTVVADSLSGEQRLRTDYAGTIWYGGSAGDGPAAPGRPCSDHDPRLPPGQPHL